MSLAKTRISVTIIPQLAKMLEEMAKKYNTSKSALVEEALRDLKEQELIKSFKLAKLDKEMREMAEEGLDDYVEQLNALEA
ncbi:ribbon-helix-helix protein, CopG family [Patescibacteria group bacterium]|nr:ribbon-helix-helix protein, CopG family [Patescibacteria group bacterium]MBU1683065.1 ribbon-helix-helix protein, CopG family [Patescibacteria group bacterium]